MRAVWFWLVLFVAQALSLTAAPATQLKVIAADRTVAVLWDASAGTSDKEQWVVERAFQPEGPFNHVAEPGARRNHVDFAVTNGGTYYYRVTPMRGVSEVPQATSPAVPARPAPFRDDEAFLDVLQHTAFEYFWREANPANGLVRDRSQPQSPCSIAAVGFGLSGINIAIERGWITRAEGRERAARTLRTFWEKPQGTNIAGQIGNRGWFYHFLNLDSGDRAWQCELSSIDTALFLAGALDAREFFNGPAAEEKEIRELANRMYERVDWRWLTDGDATLTMGWKPESGFHKMRWIGYNEAMILYLLALGAEENPLPPDAWKKWTASYEWQTHYGQSYIHFQPLFGYQYSHCWVDFRQIADDYTRSKDITYFENSRRATLAQRAYAVANPGGFAGYGSNVWGITACDGPGRKGYHGYAGRGAPPSLFDDGTIAPTGAGGSIVFTPAESLATLRHFYDQYREQIWTAYGFRDAFNLKAGWWAEDVLGIDQGPILIMAENHRTGSVWKRLMKSPEIQRGLRRAGFEAATK